MQRSRTLLDHLELLIQSAIFSNQSKFCDPDMKRELSPEIIKNLI